MATFAIGNSVACDTAIGGPASRVVSESEIIFWGKPVEAHLLEEGALASSSTVLAESYNGKVQFEVEIAVKGVKDGDLAPAYFRADGTSCEMPVTIGKDGFYFLRSLDGEYYWGQYTQPGWIGECGDYLDVFEAEFGVEFPLLRERLAACHSALD